MPKPSSYMLSRYLPGLPGISSSGLRDFRRSVLLPLLFSLYPVLALLAHNIGEVRFSAGVRALFLVVGAAYLFWLVLRLLLRDWLRAGILCALFLILFFSYGHIYSYLEKSTIFGFSLGRHRLLVPVWIAIAALLVWWTSRRLRNVTIVGSTLHWIGLVMLVFPFVQFFSFEVRTLTASARINPSLTEDSGLRYSRGTVPPNIYYIILDAYSRADILKEELGFDNTLFLSQLEEMGFTIANCSQSNYAQTELSLSSSLNFDYLPSLITNLESGSMDRSPLWPLLRRSRVHKILEENGYTVVAFETGFAWSEFRDVDVYLSPEKHGLAGLETIEGISDFEVMLVKTSGALVFADMGSFLPRFLTPDLNKPESRKRERILYTLSKLKSTQLSIRSPKFVFAHIVAPHFPYVFGPKGEEVSYPEKIDQDTYRQAYTGQLEYLNRRVIPLLREILGNSNTPPIIILQADHGHDRASVESRMKIFNAYYLPNGGSQSLYPTISPVNTFRVIFNDYFGASFPLLDDISYFSGYNAPYNFQIVPNLQGECAGGK